MQPDIAVSENPTPEERAAILAPLHAHTVAQVGETTFATFALLLREHADGPVIGGLLGRIAFDWLFIELLAVPEAMRGKGLGADLMRRGEEIARERGCVGARLDTYSFQAPKFYEKLGYREFGTIEDHPRGARRHFMYKYFDGR